MARVMPGHRFAELGSDRLQGLAQAADENKMQEFGNERLGAMVENINLEDLNLLGDKKVQGMLSGIDTEQIEQFDSTRRQGILQATGATFLDAEARDFSELVAQGPAADTAFDKAEATGPLSNSQGQPAALGLLRNLLAFSQEGT